MKSKTIEDKDRFRCTGCESCKNICPKNAISFCIEKNGYKYPHINLSLCVKCGICFSACQIGLEEDKTGFSKCFLFHSLNNSNSSSGGFSYNLGRAFLSKFENSVLYSAIFDDNLCGKYIRIDKDNLHDISRIAGSKYVKCDLLNTSKQIEQDLINSKTVLVIGLPCDILGVQMFLKAKRMIFSNIYFASLFCGGVISSSYFELYIKFLKHRKKSIATINFRDKKWKPVAYCTSITNDVGKKSFLNGIENSYINIMGSIYVRPSCLSCNLTNSIPCDFSFGDCHLPNVNDTTLIFSSDKGEELIKELGLFDFINKISVSDGIKGTKVRQPVSEIHYPEIIRKQEKFYFELNQNYKKAIRKNILFAYPFRKKIYFHLPYFFKRLYARKRLIK